MTARGLTSGMLTAIQAAHVTPILLFEGHFDDGAGGDEALRLWTGVGPLSWDGHTWLGGGKLLSISPIAESADVQAIGFSVTTSGLLTADIARALGGLRKNKDGYLWLGSLDASGAVVSDPYLLCHGRLDQGPLNDSGETSSIEFKYIDRLQALQRPRERRWTDEDQKQRSPTDTAGRHIQGLQDATFRFD